MNESNEYDDWMRWFNEMIKRNDWMGGLNEIKWMRWMKFNKELEE